MTELIRAENLTLARRRRCILDQVSLTVAGDDFVTIVGPNGAGKSSLLKCLIGLRKPDGGTIRRQPGLRIGYVPQRLTASGLIPLPVRRFLVLRNKADDESLRRVGAQTDIIRLWDKPLHLLSGGELQRVMLARALLQKPHLLVLDEPAQNLDVGGQLAFYKLMDALYHRHSLAVLMVSHDLHLVMSCSKRVVCLFHHVCCSGEPRTVARDPEFISLFGGELAQLTAVYHHSHDHQHSNA